MIPYFQIPSLFGLIHSFGVLVAIGILVGVRVTRLRAAQLGLDDEHATNMTTWAVGVGFVVAHVFDVFAYRWSEFVRDPIILVNNFSISSYGGFAGALLGIWLWHKRYKQPMLPYCDAISFGLAPGWMFGRLGCFSAHDHPGKHTSFFLAVQYPDGPRHDLGLDEALFAAFLTTLFFILYRKPRKAGLYLALECLLYAPVRLFFDALRATDTAGADPRFLGLTPAQYASILLVFVGLAILWRVRKEPAPTLATATAATGEDAKSEPATPSKKRKRK